MTQEVGQRSVINVIYHLFDCVTASADRAHVRESPTNESAAAVVDGRSRVARTCVTQVRGNNQHSFRLVQVLSFKKKSVKSAFNSRALCLVLFVYKLIYTYIGPGLLRRPSRREHQVKSNSLFAALPVECNISVLITKGALP